jgi:hypothetical protein
MAMPRNDLPESDPAGPLPNLPEAPGYSELELLLKRDLDAWEMAKAAVARARKRR